ncbi:MAG: hypothetical protein M3Q69_18240, partial [Acidobacteriota bacterium]|nr:hypothetical protein [Acidobacteriota bacterium]
LTRVDRAPARKGILIPDLDYGTGDRAVTELKLRLLESALHIHARNVIAVTTLSPWVLLDAAAQSPELEERWRKVLSTFTVRDVHPPEAAPLVLVRNEGRVVVAQEKLRAGTTGALARIVNGSPEHAAMLLEQETASQGPFLSKLGEELMRHHLRGREEIYDEVGERAAMYYANVWATCTREEKCVLHHIAADGFANPNDRRTIRRLLARGLVRRDPNFKLMNETFRRFVVADERRGEVREGADVRESAWDKIQKPLFVVLVVAGSFFFFTQRELFDASFAVVSGIVAGVPTVMRFVGVITQRDSATA